ncbi:MAG: phosphoribosyltransferase [Inhella sp.]|jgi:putative phosphoribosyl transferase|uniref:phosphoribosyltransferase n=1 Tax=Inhella sp. TaxID=1921806 RepID=UPI0022BFE5E1|nr:phosphoribosyltransferase family protein [Inhella sp.]MCZ8236578.1 phosphoribosyltransferase family protein [Inhella sp.]
MSPVFAHRTEAGQRLAQRLLGLRLPHPVVLALPRGGVPVAAEVARALGAPLDLLLVRKIGAPLQPEWAIGALAEGEPEVLDIEERTLQACGATRDDVLRTLPAHRQEIARRRALYLGGRAPLPLQGCTALLVDDGIATGATVRAAIRAVRQRQPQRVVLAVPVAPASELPALRALVDELVCLSAPECFGAVGRHYADFSTIEDADVVALMRRFGV